MPPQPLIILIAAEGVCPSGVSNLCYQSLSFYRQKVQGIVRETLDGQCSELDVTSAQVQSIAVKAKARQGRSEFVHEMRVSKRSSRKL